MIQLFAAAKCHVTPSRVKHFMKQIKRLKSLLQRRGSVRVYKMADGADGKSQMYVLFCYFAASIFVYVCFVDCCIAANC